MSLADQIRQFVKRQYIDLAREAGNQTVTVNIGDIHRAMGLHNRAPAVCGALRSKKLLRDCSISLQTWDGPSQGTSINITYLLSDSSVLEESSERPESRDLITSDRDFPRELNIWSAEIPLKSEAISVNIPREAGVYLLLQDRVYNRYSGSTRILKIGMSKVSLHNEILNHLDIHTAYNRLARILRSGVLVFVVFSVLPAETAKQQESRLLCEFEDEHWDLPLLNSQRGYKRGKDSHYRK